MIQCLPLDSLQRLPLDLRLSAARTFGGTHANRMIHRESQQLIIGPYFVDTNANVRVVSQRAEEWIHRNAADIVTGRAVAPLHKACLYFAPALKYGARVLLYKGPDADSEIAEALPETRKRQLKCKVIYRYDLPEGAGSRTIVEMLHS